MAHTHSARDPLGTWGTSWWQSILLGIVLILAGLFVLRDATAATVVSAIVFGIALLCAGLAAVGARERVLRVADYFLSPISRRR